MVFDSKQQNQANQSFFSESLELIRSIEQDLLEFLDNHSRAQIQKLLQALQTLRARAAQENFAAIHRLSGRLEQVLHFLGQQELEVDFELAQEVLQAYEYLRLMIFHQNQTQQDDITSTLVKAESILTCLENQLNFPPNGQTSLSALAELDKNDTELILETVVDQALERLEKILAKSNSPVEELSTEIEIEVRLLATMGETLALPEFVAIAQTTLATLQTNPQTALTIGKMALAGFRTTQAAALAIEAKIFSHTSNPTPIPPTTQLLQTHSPAQVKVDRKYPPNLRPSSSSAFPTSTTQEVHSRESTVEQILDTTKLLVWQVGAIVFTLPYDRIEEHLPSNANQIIPAGKQQFLYWRGVELPLYKLSELLGNHWFVALTSYRQTLTKTESPVSKDAMILVLRQGSQLLAFKSAIEHLISQPKLILTSFSSVLALPSYCYGCTLLADGRLAALIDVAALLSQTNPRFPATPSATKFILSNTPPAQETTISNTPSRKLVADVQTILVIDDTNSLRQNLTQTLQAAGYRVVQAENGLQGIRQLQNNSQIQLVLCDIEMPVLNGFGFLRYCRQHSLLAQLSVIILSSHNSEKYQQMAQQMGAIAYFVKPYNDQELLSVLKTSPVTIIRNL